MKIYKTKYFHKWATKALLTDKTLAIAANEVNLGLIDAYLGGYLYKKRIPLQNKGKRGGFRSLLAYKKDDKSIFLYGFEKNEKDNIEKFEENALKKLAKEFLSMTQKDLDFAVECGELFEVKS